MKENLSETKQRLRHVRARIADLFTGLERGLSEITRREEDRPVRGGAKLAIPAGDRMVALQPVTGKFNLVATGRPACREVR